VVVVVVFTVNSCGSSNVRRLSYFAISSGDEGDSFYYCCRVKSGQLGVIAKGEEDAGPLPPSRARPMRKQSEVVLLKEVVGAERDLSKELVKVGTKKEWRIRVLRRSL